MKKIVCEMCGGTELIKQDGVFVCQSCGCKYSVEEARKMMVEGTVEVTGTVKVDHTDSAQNLRTMADDAFAVGNYEEASNVYSKVLEIVPGDAHSLFRKGLCLINSSKVNDIKADEMIKYGDLSVKAFERTNPSEEEMSRFLQEMAVDIIKVAEMIHSAAIGFISENWKLKNNHSTYWGIEICSIGVAEYGKKILDKDSVLLFGDNLSHYQRLCRIIESSCDSLCQRREYVDSIVDGGILGPMEVKGKVWLNDSLASGYKGKASSARSDREKARDRINKKKAEIKEQERLEALRADPEELKRKIGEQERKKESLTLEENSIRIEISDLKENLSKQEAIYSEYKSKILGEGAKKKKEASANILSIKADISSKESRLETISSNLQKVSQELSALSALL